MYDTEQPPEGVELRFTDGTVIQCDVKRLPERDYTSGKGRNAREITYWLAVPQGDYPGGTFRVHVDRLPAHTGFTLPDEWLGNGGLLGMMSPPKG